MTQDDETMIQVDDDVQLCVQTIGERGDPALLLIGGATWSMDWWNVELCQRLADRHHLVVRYDQRDTGRSTHYPVGSPTYTGADLVADAIAVLDALGIDRAHVVGLSMGGGVAQRLALEYRERVATLTLVSTSSIDPVMEGLPGPTSTIQATFIDPAPEPDWQDREAVIQYVVEGERPYAGPGTFDEARVRAMAGRVFDRTADLAASMTNHFVLGDDESGDLQLSRLAGVPTLVVHGTADPLFPVEHGHALADAIPGARLIELAGVGHELPPSRTWGQVVDALAQHTSRG